MKSSKAKTEEVLRVKARGLDEIDNFADYSRPNSAASALPLISISIHFSQKVPSD